MNYRILGRTGLRVSEIGHGLWGMGGWSGSDDSKSMQSLQLSLEKGCNFFDTAWAYGDGKSDKLLGQLITRNPNAEIIAACKIPPKNLKWPGSRGDNIRDVFPKKHVFEYTERILESLGTTSIDLLQFHVWDDSWTDDDDWKQAISDLKARKFIKSFGISLNRWEPWNGIRAIRTGLVDVVQVIYNIFDQAPEDELFPFCDELNIGVIARVPLDEGGLTGKMTRDTRFPDDDWRAKYFGSENLGPTVDRAEALKKILPAEMSLPELALRFILANKSVDTTIVGMRNTKYVIENTSVSDGQDLPETLLWTLRSHRWDRIVTPWAN